MTTLAELTPAQQHLIRTASARLEREFAGVFGRETIEQYIADSSSRILSTATITEYAPIFIERFARDRLKALAKIEGHVADGVPSVLFLCVHNAGRSQMAAAWLRRLAGDRVTVLSGGSEPAGAVNAAAIEAMAEVDVDMRTEFPKPWTEEIVRAADVVVTMGCGDACPLYPGKRYEDWVLDDPAGRPLDEVRVIRDEIRRRVETLLASLGLSVTN